MKIPSLERVRALRPQVHFHLFMEHDGVIYSGSRICRDDAEAWPRTYRDPADLYDAMLAAQDAGLEGDEAPRATDY